MHFDAIGNYAIEKHPFKWKRNVQKKSYFIRKTFWFQHLIDSVTWYYAVGTKTRLMLQCRVRATINEMKEFHENDFEHLLSTKSTTDGTKIAYLSYWTLLSASRTLNAHTHARTHAAAATRWMGSLTGNVTVTSSELRNELNHCKQSTVWARTS